MKLHVIIAHKQCLHPAPNCGGSWLHWNLLLKYWMSIHKAISKMGKTNYLIFILPAQLQDLVLHQFLLLLLLSVNISDMLYSILTSFGHNNKCMNAHDQFGVKGHVGVTGVKKVIFTKNTIILFLLQITWNGPVTHAYSSARYLLQKLSAQILIWGHLGSQGSKGHFHQKCYFSYRLHGLIMWLMHMNQLDTLYKSYRFKF